MWGLSLVRRGSAVGAMVVLVLTLGAAPADAHAVLVSTDPVDGTNLATAPSRLTLTFDEPVEVGSTVVHLFDDAGRSLDVGTPTSAVPADQEDSTSVSAALPWLRSGRYLVRWQSITSDDFHPVDGSLTFGVDADVQAAGTPTARGLASPWEAAARFVVIAGYSVAVGGLALLLVLRPLLLRRPEARRVVVRGAMAGAGVAVVGLFVLLALLAVSAGALPSTSFVGFWCAAMTGLLVAAASVIALDPSPHRRPGPPVPAVGMLAALLSAWGLGHLGHGGSSAGSLLTTMHVAAAACWAGGLVLLVPASLAARRDGDTAWSRLALGRFARIAIPALTVSVVSGALLARGLVPGWAGLTDTAYGRGLVLKLGLLALGVLLGGWTAWRVRGSTSDGRVGGRLGAETAAVVAILALAAALAGGQPPDDRRWWPYPEVSPTASLAGVDVDDLVVTLALSPGSPGPNFATVRVLDSRRPAPAPVDAVVVDDGDGRPVAAVRQNDTDWLVPLALDRSGPLSVAVTVRRSGWADARTTFVWQVAPAAGTEQGGADLSGVWLTLAAAGMVSGAAVALVAVRLDRRRRAQADAEAPQRELSPV